MNFIKQNKKIIIIGIVFSLLALPVGLFLGLQVSIVAANILLFPWIVLSAVFQVPLENMGILGILFGLLFSAAFWSTVFAITGKLVYMVKRK